MGLRRPVRPTGLSRRLRLAITALAGLLTAICIAIVALTARHIAFVENLPYGRRTDMSVQWDDWSNARQRWESKTSSIDYIPGNWTMRDTRALLVTATLGTFLGLCIAGLTLSPRDLELRGVVTGRRVRQIHVDSLLIALLLSTALSGALAAGLAVSWQQHNDLRWAYWSRPADSGRYEWNFEKWNCEIAPSVSANATAVTTLTLRSLCSQAKAARILILCAFVLASVCMLVVLRACFGIYRLVRRDDRCEACAGTASAASKARELEVRSVSQGTTESEAVRNSSDGQISGTERAAAEMPTPSFVEMEGDAGRTELYGTAAASTEPRRVTGSASCANSTTSERSPAV